MLLDPVYERVSSLVGAPAEQLKVITCLLLAFPLGSIYVRLPHNRPNVSHWFSLAISATFFIAILGDISAFVHLLVACVGTYGIVVWSRSPNMPWVVFFWVMGHLLANHFKRLIGAVPEGAFDVTFSQMVIAQKLTSFAWNVHDGRRKLEDLDAAQQALRLQHVPSPLAYLGYCFFFPSVLIGPSLDYVTYDSLVLGTIYNNAPPGHDDSQAKLRRRVPHGRKRVAYLHLIIGLGFLGIYAVYGGRAAYSRILSPSWYTWGTLTKLGFVQLAGLVARMKYYAVWSLSEGACILTGAGFNGYDPKTGRTLWNRLRNVNIPAIETAESFKVLFDSWNCRTNVWLRDCMYKRLVKKGKKPGSKESMATFFTSAVWHGLEPGYYLAFITGGVYVSLGRQLRRFVRPYVLPPSSTPQSPPNSLPKYPYPNLAKRVYDVIGWIMVQVNLNYTASAFLLLGFKDSLKAWNRMYWHGHVMILVTSLFFHFGGRRALQKRLPAGPPKGEVPSIKVAPPSPDSKKGAEISSPPHDEDDARDLRWVKHALDNPSHKDAGRGVNPADMVDRAMEGADTPYSDLSRSGSPRLR